MTPSLMLNDLLIWSLQIGLLVALAAVLPPLLRLKLPGAKLAFWQIALVACLLLPVLRAWKQDAVSGAVTVSTTIVSIAPSPAARHFTLPPIGFALLLLAAGILVRCGFLLAGLWRLHRYRLQSQPLQPASPWGAEADLLISDEIASPVTFGFRRPVVLLPARFPSLDEATRDAILCHEILHVRRHDWLFTVGEEFVRAMLWFHPAIWWLLGEIQLTREQAVDREVVEMMRSRDQYIDALLVIAGAPPQLDLAPAPLFLRKRHLKQRVVSILKEVHMSKARSISVLAAGLTMLAASCWFVTGALPLKAAPQVVEDASGVSVEMNGAQLMHRQPVAYPAEAIAKGIQGTVVAQVKLDAAGNVSDASILSGPEELRKAVLQSVLNWHFANDAANSTRQVSIAFQLPQRVPQSAAAPGRPVPDIVSAPPPSQSASQPTLVLKAVRIAGLSDEQRDALLARLPVREGDTIDPATLSRIAETIRAFDEHLRFIVPGDGTLFISTPDSRLPGIPLPPAPGAPSQPIGYAFSRDAASDTQTQSTPPPIRVGGNVAATNLVTKVTPAYPLEAKAARIQGTVRFDATIAKDGTVQSLHLVSGPPELVNAALQAVQQWVYRPTLLNGNPIEVITTIDINFTLSK